MPNFRLSAKAKADLKSIARYTQETWGREQRNKYLAKVDESFHSLSREPQRGRACDDIREGYFKHHISVIFFVMKVSHAFEFRSTL